MFEAIQVAANRKREVRSRLASLPAALVVHAMTIALVMAGQLWAVQPVTDPETPVVFVEFAPPSPPPAPPGPQPGEPQQTPRQETRQPAEPTQPTTIPQQSATAGPPDPSSSSNVVPGSVGPGSKIGIPGSVGNGPPVVVAPPPDDTHPVRPGRGIVMPVGVHRPAPVYPEIARRARVEGTVVVEATIDRGGNVVDTKVLRDPGMGCGDAVVEAVRTWRYRPASFNGRPVSIILTVTVEFRLAGGM